MVVAMSEIWINESWRNECLAPKTKRLHSDAVAAMQVLESDPDRYNLACIIYSLHGSKTKQWAYSTNRPDVITLMVNVLDDFSERMPHQGMIEFHYSYPAHSVQSLINDIGDDSAARTQAERDWVVGRWSELLSDPVPDISKFHPRANTNQKTISLSEPPGSIEIRLQKSLGVLMAFRRRGVFLLGEAINQ